MQGKRQRWVKIVPEGKRQGEIRERYGSVYGGRTHGYLSRKDFLRLGGAGVAGLTLLGGVACGGGSGGGGNTLNYWASNQGASIDQDERILGKAVKEFKKQSGISVKIKVIPWSDLYNNILTATTSGQGPDVLNIGNTWSASLQATGAFLPFDREMLDKIGGKSKFLSSSFAASGAPGETPTSVPLYGLSYGMFYNKKLFQEAGISAPPKTWDEFVATAKELTGSSDRWGMALEGASVTENAHWAFFLGKQYGGSLFTQSGKPTFDSPEIVSAVTQYVNFLGKEKIASPACAEYSDGISSPTDFANGKAAMLVYQNNAERILRTSGMPDDEYGVAKVPLPDPLPPGGEPIMSHVAGINLSIFNNAANQEGALEFVKFLTGNDQQVELNEAFQSLPVTEGARGAKEFSDEKLKVFNEILANNAEPMPLIPEEGKMETLIGDAVKQLFAKAATGGAVSEGEVKEELSAANQKMAAGG
jgi:multiple sugar transport system substrate-binding protein